MDISGLLNQMNHPIFEKPIFQLLSKSHFLNLIIVNQDEYQPEFHTKLLPISVRVAEAIIFSFLMTEKAEGNWNHYAKKLFYRQFY